MYSISLLENTSNGVFTIVNVYKYNAVIQTYIRLPYNNMYSPSNTLLQNFTNGSIFYLAPQDAFNISIISVSSVENQILASSKLSIALLTTGEPGRTGPTGPTGANVWSSNPNLSIYYSSGNVGINRNDPQSTLDVSGNAIMNNLFISGTTPNFGTITTGAVRVAGGVAIGGNNFIQGNLVIGGNITCIGNASFGNVFTNALYISSDYRLKGNVFPISITKTVDLLKPVEYDHTTGHQMGFIAHEIQQEYPFLVSGKKDGPEIQTVNYNGLIALLVKEIQELKTRMKEAEETIQQLLQR